MRWIGGQARLFGSAMPKAERPRKKCLADYVGFVTRQRDEARVGGYESEFVFKEFAFSPGTVSKKRRCNPCYPLGAPSPSSAYRPMMLNPNVLPPRIRVLRWFNCGCLPLFDTLGSLGRGRITIPTRWAGDENLWWGWGSGGVRWWVRALVGEASLRLLPLLPSWGSALPGRR
jgi:hypothetical protein